MIQPYVASTMIENGMARNGVDISDPSIMENFAQQYTIDSKGFRLDEHDMRKHMGSIGIPTMMVQVKNDPSFGEESTLELYNLIEVEDKEMFWIEDTSIRFDGYQYFSDHPERMIEWFGAHTK